MTLSSKDRQRKWQKKQKAEGRKRFTVMMDRESYTVIKRVKETTGESISGIINRAVLMLDQEQSPKTFEYKEENIVSGNDDRAKADVAFNETALKIAEAENKSEKKKERISVSTNENRLIQEEDKQKKEQKHNSVSANEKEGRRLVIKRIVAMMGVVGLTEDEVAKRFNEEGVETLNGFDEWDEETVGMLYRQEVT